MNRLDGKVAIITGAGSGMGAAAVKIFVEEGAKVVAVDLSEEGLNKVKDSLENPDNILTLTHDISKDEAWEDITSKAVDSFGKIDILVNNAGIHIAEGIVEASKENWDKVINVNLTGVWLGMKYVIPYMQENGSGSIVNTSSIAAIAGGVEANGGGAAYTASKGAVRSLTKHAAIDYAEDNIRVNSVHPGPIFTGLAENVGIKSQEEMGENYTHSTPIPPHAGESDDIAYAYLYLASDESKFVTGIELLVDGGSIAH